LVAAFGSSPTQDLQLAHRRIRDGKAGAVAEEARQDVEVDLVDPAALEQLRADRGREDPFRPSVPSTPARIAGRESSWGRQYT
jgi:hypothetical protein